MRFQHVCYKSGNCTELSKSIAEEELLKHDSSIESEEISAAVEGASGLSLEIKKQKKKNSLHGIFHPTKKRRP